MLFAAPSPVGEGAAVRLYMLPYQAARLGSAPPREDGSPFVLRATLHPQAATEPIKLL